MRTIGLTRVLPSDRLAAIYVNPDHIVSYSDGWNGGAILVLTTASLSVKESPEQITGLLEQHLAGLRAEEHGAGAES